jgi:O-antigen ligase
LIELFFRRGRYQFRIFATAIFVVQAYALLLLASRSTWVAGIVAAVIMLMWQTNVSIHRRIVALGLMGVVVSAGMFYLPGGESLVKRFTEEGDLGTLNLRVVLWRISLNRIAERDLMELAFGEGLYSSAALFYRFSAFGAAHNMYLTWLLEEGLLGFLLFSWFLFFIGKHLFGSKHRGTTILIGWYTYLVVVGLAADISNSHVFWLVLGVVAGAGAFVKKPARRGKDAMNAKYGAGVPLPNLAYRNPVRSSSR